MVKKRVRDAEDTPMGDAPVANGNDSDSDSVCSKAHTPAVPAVLTSYIRIWT